jgi:beta-carotene 15,15'-monooxygenase
MDGPLGFHSLNEETTADLVVAGDLPAWLSGTLVRNGPGSFDVGDSSVDHWFDGLAMLHRFAFDGDGGVEYRNRFLRTDAFAKATAGSFDGGFATGDAGLLRRLWRLVVGDTYDNTNVIAERVGDECLAFTETPRWVTFDPETLETLGSVEYAGDAPVGHLSCAHLQRDPATDRLVSFDVEFGRPSYYHVYELRGPREREPVASVAVDRPAYMHSFALTPNYVVLTEFPFVVDPLSFLRPGTQGPFVDHYEWAPDRGTRFRVLDRETGAEVAAPTTEAFFGFHHVNAFERGAADDTGSGGDGTGSVGPGGDGTGSDDHPPELVVDLETVPTAESVFALSLDTLRSGSLDAFAGSLERFRLDLAEDSPTVRRELLHEGTALPTVSPARWLREHRYVYAQGTEQPVTDWPESVVKVDVETGEATAFTEPDTHFGEPIFVPAPAADREAEDDGVVLTVALDVAQETSWLLVLDGRSFTERARAELPHAIPFDFHGRWFPAGDEPYEATG